MIITACGQSKMHIIPHIFCQVYLSNIILLKLLLDEKVLCGSVVRLEHALSKKNLHSHDFQSPVSGKSEVSCFGNDGNGDTGINFIFS